MKRKLLLLSAIILSLSLLLTACGQKDIGEAKAKELGLAYINQYFNTNETEAKVYRERYECYPEQAGAFSTNGDTEFSYRWVYRVQVPLAASLIKYDVFLLGSTGELMYATQHQMNIILSDEQKERAYSLYAEEPRWGEKHIDAQNELKHACYDWAIQNLDEPRPIILDANQNKRAGDAVQRTFSSSYYVVTRDGMVYLLTMDWPSLQMLYIWVENSN